MIRHHLLTSSDIRLYRGRHWRALKVDAKEVLYLLLADDLPEPSVGCALSDTSCCNTERGLIADTSAASILSQREDLLPGGRGVALGQTCTRSFCTEANVNKYCVPITSQCCPSLGSFAR